MEYGWCSHVFGLSFVSNYQCYFSHYCRCYVKVCCMYVCNKIILKIIGNMLFCSICNSERVNMVKAVVFSINILPRCSFWWPHSLLCIRTIYITVFNFLQSVLWSKVTLTLTLEQAMKAQRGSSLAPALDGSGKSVPCLGCFTPITHFGLHSGYIHYSLQFSEDLI
jgi:hypothetical protein